MSANATIPNRIIPRKSNSQFSASSQSNKNNIFAVIGLIFLGLSPIPLGSNRPVFWIISGLIVATISLAYFTLSIYSRSNIRSKPKVLTTIIIPYLILLGFIILQLIPLGSWVSPIAIAINDTVIYSQTLSLTPGLSFLSLLQFLTYGLLFFLILQLAHNTERAHKMLIALFVIITAYAAYSIIALTQLGDPILFIEKWAYQGYATGTFVNRNSFATYLGFGLILGVTFIAGSLLPDNHEQGHSRSLLSALLYAIGVAIIFAALIATQSRMGFIAGFIGSVFTVILVLSKAPNPKKIVLPAIFTSIIGTIILFFLYGGGLLERVGSVESATDVRFALYEQVVGMIANRPWTGFGAGSFELAFPLFHQLPVSPDLVWDKAHNTYLSLWVELGIIFGSIPILLIIIIGWRTWKIFHLTKRRWIHAAISLGAIITAAIHSLADFSLEIHAVALLFVVLLAIGMSGNPSLKSPNKS